MNKISLSGTQLKMIAIITMVIDHVGMVLLDDFIPFRIIGRLSFPLFALLIAEGCRYTRNKKRYFGIILALGLICQTAAFISGRSLFMDVLITFSLSILVIYSIDYARRHPLNRFAVALPVVLILAVVALTEWTPTLVPAELGLDYMFDYGFLGVMLPVAAYYYEDKKKRCYAMGAVLLLLGFRYFWIQLFGLITLPLIWAYNGERGMLANKPAMKYAFYIFYPLHWLVIYGIELLR